MSLTNFIRGIQYKYKKEFMAINFIEEKETSLKVEINNSHLKRLKEITDSYGIDGEAKTLGFLISVIDEVKGKPITIGDRIFQPAEEIKKKNE